MSELDSLISKSKEDIEAIAVQFGDYTPAVAATKSKEELIASIAKMSVKDVQTAMYGESEPKPKKEKAPAKSSKPKNKKPTPKKAEAKVETPAEVLAEEPVVKSQEVAEVKVDAKPEATEVKSEKPKRGRKKKTETKAEEAPVEVVTETKAEVASEATKETSVVEEKKPKAKRGKKKKTEETLVESVPAEASQEPSEVTENTPSEETPVEASEEKVEGKKNSKNRKKRRISFGPEQETKEVEIPEGEAVPESEASEEEAQPEKPQPQEPQYIEIEGILEIGSGDNKNDFNGFVHTKNYLPGEDDAYVPGQMIRRLGLRKGDHIKGLAVAPHGKDRYAPLRKVLEVNGVEIPEDSDFEITKKRPRFESLTAIYPDQRLKLETGKEDLSTRIIDLFCPIGKGQRGMIVSPPKAGKTVLLKKVANAITENNPECKVIVLLIDERPEEVTDMQRSIKGEVVYSTFDKRPENHVRVTELVLERAMRLVELGQDVVILLDSMTRLARAYNLTINPTGRTLSGGLDPGSLYGPKRFFGAARNIEFGGSLTIIASALIETGSRMDEVIFEEFKGTGNMEVVLDRKLADRRVYPAIAVDKSGTRREDLLLTPEQLSSVWLTRKAIADVDTIAGTEAVLNFMKRTTNNASFVLSAQKSFAVDS
ncbi:MAG: transcription termination factor Rho [Saccharofermentans sp.]|nr:transcription termination factor Rho [Saccharofermentans sp.]